MGDDSKWKRRLPTRIYNYNYKVSEGYYKPQTEYLENREYTTRNNKSPPHHQSYAERFATSPWYGDTKGLPYGEHQSAGPLIKLGDRQLRSSSLLREMKELEEEGIPLNIRASRRKKRYEEEDEMLGIRQRMTNRTNSLESAAYQHPKSKESRAKDIQFQVQQKIKSLDDELLRSTQTAAAQETPSKWSYDLDRCPKKVVRLREENYVTPYSGTTVKRSSHSEYSSSSSSRPPVVPMRSRRISGGGSEKDPASSTRIRVNSIGEYSAVPRTSRRSSQTEEDLALYTNRAPRLREERKMREAQDFTSDISKLVDKMRVRKVDVDPLVAYSHGRHSRSSSIDRTPLRRGSKTSRYVYGIGKI